MRDAEFIEQLSVIIELVPYNESFQQRAAKINRQACRLVNSNFFFEIRSNVSASKTKLQQVNPFSRRFHEVFCLSKTQSLIHDHGQSCFARLFRSLRKTTERK